MKRTTRERRTQVDTLFEILSDRRWHSTKELARRVGHAFAVSKFTLVHRFHYNIERRRHPTLKRQHEYRRGPDIPTNLPTVD